MSKGAAAAASAFVRVLVEAWRCTCQRCGHVWHVFTEVMPRSCAGCKVRNWWVPAGVLKRGRKPLKATKTK